MNFHSPCGKYNHFKLVGIFLAALAALAAGYLWFLRGIASNEALNAIGARALHDRQALQTTLTLLLDELSGIERRIQFIEPPTLRALQKSLHNESSTTFFRHIYLIANDGRVFTDTYLTYASLPKFLSGLEEYLKNCAPGQKFILDYGHRTQFLTVPDRDMIIFGLRLNSTTLAGQKIEAIAATIGRDFLKRSLLADHFIRPAGFQSSASLIDMDGHYVINAPKSKTPGASNNFYATLAEAVECGLDDETIRAKMEQHETFNFRVLTAGGRKLYFMLPFTAKNFVHPNWYLALSSGISPGAAIKTPYGMLLLSLLGAVILLMAVIMAYALRSAHKLYAANEQVKARSDFLSSMSHEIRTPLNGLIGLNYLITTHLGEKERLPQIRDWLKKSRSLADYLLSLLNDILDMSKLQAGKINLVLQPFSIDAMLDDIWFMQSAGMEKNGIHFEIKRNIAWPWVSGDETRIKQVLTNILGNAAKFTPRGGKVTLEASQASPSQGQIETTYYCQDNGVGMSAAFLEKIFDPFSQETGEWVSKGTGLGMPICKELTEAMGGTIKVESAPGSGTIFVVRIPTLAAEPMQGKEYTPIVDIPSPLAAPGQNSDGKNKKKILLAEDADFNAEFLTELLEDEGFEVKHAENGMAAIELFKASPVGYFDIVLMDMQMPVMNGCEAARAIRSLARDDAKSVLIYACTASTFKADVDEAMQSGMNDFLTKPINIKTFLEKLKQQK